MSNITPICWCSPHPNHYNNYLFQNISAIPGCHLELVFFKKVLAKYPWQSSLEIRLNSYYLNLWFKVDWKWLIKEFPFNKLYVVAGWNEPTMIILLSWLSFTNKPFIIWSDTPKAHTKKSIKNFLRGKWLNLIFERCKYFFVTGLPGVDAVKKMGVADEKVVNFPFATNLDYFRPSELGLPMQNIIVSSGRLDIRHKGYDTALNALKICKSRRPDLKFTYLIAGAGPDENFIRQLIDEFKLDVHLIGWLEAKDLLNFYHRGNLLIHPSNFDPFPNAILEGMACGLPVIASRAAGSALDRIIEGENGFLHRNNDPEELAEKIITFLSLSKEDKDRLSKSARSTAEKWHISYHVSIFKQKVLYEDQD